MKYSDIVRRVQKAMGDDSGVLFTSVEIHDWITDGVIDVARRTEVLKNVSAVAPTGNTPMQVIIPNTQLLDVYRVAYNGKVLKGLALEEVDLTHPNWLSSDNTPTDPQSYWLFGDDLFVFPGPPVGGSNITVWYSYIPNNIPGYGDGTTVIPLPLWLHEDVLIYCLMKAAERDDNYSAFDRYKLQYEERALSSMEEEGSRNSDTYPSVVPVAEDIV